MFGFSLGSLAHSSVSILTPIRRTKGGLEPRSCGICVFIVVWDLATGRDAFGRFSWTPSRLHPVNGRPIKDSACILNTDKARESELQWHCRASTVLNSQIDAAGSKPFQQT